MNGEMNDRIQVLPHEATGCELPPKQCFKYYLLLF